MPSLSYLGQSWCHSNKLQSAIFEFLKTQDRVHLQGEQVAKFKRSILLKIEDLNEQYPRCKPCNAHWSYLCKNTGDSSLSTGDQQICDFRIYASLSKFID